MFCQPYPDKQFISFGSRWYLFCILFVNGSINIRGPINPLNGGCATYNKLSPIQGWSTLSIRNILNQINFLILLIHKLDSEHNSFEKIDPIH